MKIVIKAISFEHAFNRLRVAGIRTRDNDGEGHSIPQEYMIEKCCTQTIVCSDGQVVFATDIDFSRVDKIPDNDTPNFDVIYREDIGGEWPTVEVDCEPYQVAIEWDEDGKPTAYETLTTRVREVTRVV